MNDKQKRRRTRKTLLGITGMLLLIAFPFVVTGSYLYMTALPKHVVIASGPDGGLYQVLSQNLAEEIRRQLNISVTLDRSTQGSLDNLKLLRSQKVDFALYQPGTEWILQPSHGSDETVQAAFIANLYPEVAHWFVRRDAGITSPADLVGKKVAVGNKTAGDYAMSRLLLEHLGLTEDEIDAQHLSYSEVREGFQNGTLDAAFITVGVRAEILHNLAEDDTCDLLSIPNALALTTKFVLPTPFIIPSGMYDSYPATFPPEDVSTIALRANLLTHEGVDENLVEQVTQILLSKEFL